MDTETSSTTANAAPMLTANEARVLGVLVEKASLTPDAYPLTANAVQLGANQKTSREPITELSAGEVGHALRTLEDKKLVRVVHGSRASRYEHRMDEALRVTPKQRALLAMMMLRGPQTLNELSVRTERLASFAGMDDVRETIDRLCHRDPPFALRIARASGQREDRYAHLLAGEVGLVRATEPAAEALPVAANRDELVARIDALEARVAQLEALLAERDERPLP